MDTMYIALNARRLKVSGGADLVRLTPTPMEAPVQEEPCELLDFARCCRKLERKAALRELERPVQAPQTAEKPRRRDHRAVLPWALELCASAAALAAGIAGAWTVFGL